MGCGPESIASSASGEQIQLEQHKNSHAPDEAKVIVWQTNEADLNAFISEMHDDSPTLKYLVQKCSEELAVTRDLR